MLEYTWEIVLDNPLFNRRGIDALKHSVRYNRNHFIDEETEVC